MKLALLLALGLDPTVHVEVIDRASGRGAEVSGWVTARLREEGYAVAPRPEAAGRRLTVVHQPEGWTITVEGETTHEQAVPPSHDSLERLEVLHRMVESLEMVAPAAEPARAAVTVAVEASGRDAIELEQAVVEALLARGVAAAGPEPEAARRFCVRGDADGSLRVAVAASWVGCSAVALARATPVERDGLEGAMTRALDGEPLASRRPERGPAKAHASPEGRSDGPAPAAAERERSPIAVGLEARSGIVNRGDAVDALVGLGLRLGADPGVGGRVTIEVWPSGRGAVAVHEIAPAVGLDGRLQISRRMFFTVGLELGALVHVARVPAGRQETRAAFWGAVPVGWGIRVAKGLHVALAVRVGRSHRAERHVVDAQVAWERVAWQIGAHAALGYDWGIR